MALSAAPRIGEARVSAYRLPTEEPESDGTLQWEATTLVLVELSAGGLGGLGYTYAHAAAAHLIHDALNPLLLGKDPTAIPDCSQSLLAALRNLGQGGLSAMALSAVDNALWDLKAKLLDVPVAALLGAARECVPAYASGGFTSYSRERLCRQIARWRDEGFGCVKMKVGREPLQDAERVAAAREALGAEAALFVDANGAYSLKQALEFAWIFREQGVTWLEEPLSSKDLEGLRLLRERGPAGLDISAGEYGDGSVYFRRMLASGAVDVLQADATRCGGISGFMKAAALCEAFELPLSSHCAPLLHLHCGCAAPPLRHLEYFHDHARIETRLFDGMPAVEKGLLGPAWDRPGLGVEFRRADAQPFAL